MYELDRTFECRNCSAINKFNEELICDFCKFDNKFKVPEHLTDLSHNDIVELMNSAFHRLELFMKGKLKEYSYFGFNDAFTKLFFETKKIENCTVKNYNLVITYYVHCCNLYEDIDKGQYKNEAVNNDINFTKEYFDISLIINRYYEIEDFDTDTEDYDFSKPQASFSEVLKGLETKQEQTEADKYDVLKNKDITIFRNDIGFTIFAKMFELYKNQNTHLANFSFLFYAMEKDFLVCSQTDFIKFLESEKYNVYIEKIDSRQSGKNKKENLYNSIKEKYQTKTIKAQ